MSRKRKARQAPSQVATPSSVAGGGERLWRRHGWPLLTVWGLVLTAYSNSFRGALVFDSASVIGRDPRIRQATLQNVESILTGGYWYVVATSGLFRPITTLSYLVNYAVLGNGPDPVGYHWVNLLLHEFNVALVYALGALIFEAMTPALALAAIWGLHPLLTDAVTNIVGRADLLAAFGVLAGLFCHAKGASFMGTGRHRMAWLAGLAAAQTIGLFSKESGAVLPGVMLLYDLTWPERATWRRRLPSYAVVALPLAIFFSLRAGFGIHMLIDHSANPLVSAGFWTARLTAVEIMGKYLWLFLWPARLSADYSYNAVPVFGWRLRKAILPSLRRDRMGRALIYFPGFFFLTLLPASNLIILIGSIMAERFLYLPSVGLAGCIVAAVSVAGRRLQFPRRAAAPAAWAALGLVCLAFAARTYARNLDWQDGLSLWTSTVYVCPESALAHYNLANELERIPGRLPEAIAEYRQAVRIDPDRADAHDNLGNALSGMPGGLPEAIGEYRAALRTGPDYAAVHNDLANALARMPGSLPEAIAEYRAALRLQPDNAETHYNLGIALAGMPGRLPEAIAEYRTALRLQPDHADAHNNLGIALAGMPGRLPEAIAEYNAALRIRPDNGEAHVNLGIALSRIPGRLPEAIAEYRTAVRLQPGNAEAHYNLGIALAGNGGLPEAIVEFEAAVRSEPDFVEAHAILGKALAQTPGRLPEAIAEYEAALRLRPDPQVRQALDRLRAGSR